VLWRSRDRLELHSSDRPVGPVERAIHATANVIVAVSRTALLRKLKDVFPPIALLAIAGLPAGTAAPARSFEYQDAGARCHENEI
jgi:hypothetical protein